MFELDVRAQEHELKAFGHWCISKTKTLLAGIGKSHPIARPGYTADGMPTLTWAMTEATPMQPEQIAAQLDTLAAGLGAKPVAAPITLAGRIARMSDLSWWLRNLRRETIRKNETIEHQCGHIRRKKQCYASDHAHKLKRERNKANRAILESLEVVNETGFSMNLLEAADTSVSNPALRRAELMVRARGFEEIAEIRGDVAIFLTITCPSRFHRFTGSALDNKNWTEDTPRDAQDYLCEIWAKIRAAWARRGFFPYGFRVAEPHHDGCPHWHILLFVKPEQVGWFEPERLLAGRKDHGAGVIGIVGKYALKDHPAERGAVKHRYTVERIDTTKGSATGYIAKYIAKNIDGLTEAGDNVGLDFASGKKASDTAPRVRTWASVWNIRQFQQIGGPSVTVWRELRRLGAPERGDTPDLFAGPQDAADQGDYGIFWQLQGGPDVRRKDLTLSPAYTEDSTGKYGDPVKRVFGVNSCDGKFRKTKTHTWTVQRAGLAVVNVLQAEHSAEVKSAAAVARFLSEAGEFAAGFSAHRAAWTGVNNCTVLGFDFSGFDPEPPPEIGHWTDYTDGLAPWVRDGFIYKQPIFRADPVGVATEVDILNRSHQKDIDSWTTQRQNQRQRKPCA